jgi:hypothetical protein
MASPRGEGRSGTKFRLQLVVVNDSGEEQLQEVARIEREGAEIETPRTDPGVKQTDLEEDPGRRGPGAPELHSESAQYPEC